MTSGVRLALGAIGAVLTLFGGYLLYEKVWHALIVGATEERAGVITRAEDPVFFWLWFGTYGVIGTGLAALGLWALVRTVKG